MKSTGSLIKTLLILVVVLAAVVLSPRTAMAQTYDQELAAQYMNAREFDKAAILWEQLYDKYRYRQYLTNYLKCLSELKEFEKAEKFIKKEVKRNENDPSLLVELGLVYVAMGNTQDADAQFNKAIKLSAVSKAQTINTANYFLTNRMFDYAEVLYTTAAAQQKVNFDFELANLYYFQRNYQRMTEKFLDLLFEFPDYLNSVESRYQYIMASSTEDDLNQLLETNLLMRIQKYPQKTVYAELLIWQYTQTGRYQDAYTQIVSIDKKSNGGGKRLIEFGQMLSENGEYELALTCFDYVLKTGETNPNYQFASIEYLNTLYRKVIHTPSRTTEELIRLEGMLKESIIKTRTKQAFSLIYALANIQAFYLNKTQEAANFLKAVIDENKLQPNEISECKLLYGDILLFDNNPWDATLIYAQVEKANANNPFGHEARFRKARLAYYTGQFEWALAQLDILKAGTSRLIANDAFELSLFISDNSALDTTYMALSMFARSDLLRYKHQEAQALLTLDSILTAFPGHELLDDVHYRKATIYESLGRYSEAAEAYQTVVKNYPYDILGDNALHQLARLYDYTLKDKTKAMELYKQLMTDYPSSIYTVEARKRFRFLRGDRLSDSLE